jgi:predicted amidophosphoribosyltransferase
MALINCPECAKQISDKATACPHCGLPGSYFTTGNRQVLEHGATKYST